MRLLRCVPALIGGCLLGACSTVDHRREPPRIVWSEARKIADKTAAEARHGVTPTDALYHVKTMFNYDERKWAVSYYRRYPTRSVFLVVVDDNTGAASYFKK